MAMIDNCFTVDRQSWGTYRSYDEEGKALITSMTKEDCIAATRWFLKAKQDGTLTSDAATYNGTVEHKL